MSCQSGVVTLELKLECKCSFSLRESKWSVPRTATRTLRITKDTSVNKNCRLAAVKIEFTLVKTGVDVELEKMVEGTFVTTE